MLSYNDLKPGTVFVWNDEPWQVLEYQFLRKQQRKPVARTKIRNLINGKLVEQTFQYSDEFEEADIERRKVMYIYERNGEFWFTDIDDKSNRFSLSEELVGSAKNFLIPNTEVTAVEFDDNIIGVELPIKINLKVTEAPPNVKGNTAQGGNKQVTLETGTVVSTPMFIEAGDVIRVNTQTGLYVERAEKAR